MQITQVEITKYSTNFKRPLVTAHDTYNKREGLFLKLSTSSDQVGFGEVAPLPGFSVDTLDAAFSSLRSISNPLKSLNFPNSPELLKELIEGLVKDFPLTPAARFGLESALCDLISQSEKLPLANWLNPNSKNSLLLNILLPSNPEEARQYLETKGSENTVYKFKLTQDYKFTTQTIKILLSLLPKNAKLRIDANQLYDFSEAESLLKNLDGLSIEYIEEPLKNPTLSELEKLASNCSVPIALDESLGNYISVESALEARIISVLVLKPTILGGIFRTICVAHNAISSGKKIVLTSTLESGPGVIQNLHTALALEAPLLACGLNTLSLLEDLFLETSPRIEGKVMYASRAPGLGIQLNGNFDWQDI